jgi:hypothetical protein
MRTKLPSCRRSLGLILAAAAISALSSCVSQTPEQVEANSVTRHEQRAEGIQDPMKDPR